MDVSLPYRPTSGFDGLYGLTISELDERFARAEVPVREVLLQPAGLVHGGVYAAIAESVASIATAHAVAPLGASAVGLSNHTSFLRPILRGTIHARAHRRHAGRTTWIWEVEISDDEDRLCALTRMTVAVRPQPAPSPPGA
jgi:1,4-dihydroxy-2-naphthoyl-CoA hydrolase